MKNGKWKSNFEQIWNRMKLSFQDFLISQDQQFLHQFRIEVKKLNAIITLIASHDEESPLVHDFKNIKKIFKHAGKIRDPYLHIKLIQNNKLKLPVFVTEQQDILLRETNSFISSGNDYEIKINKTEKRILKNVNKISIKKAKVFNKLKIEEINNILSQHIFDDSLHDARKLLKTILLSQLLFNKKKRKKLHLNEPYLDHMQNLIGEWHDLVNITEILNKKKVKKERLITTININIKALEEKIIADSKKFKVKATSMDEAVINQL